MPSFLEDLAACFSWVDDGVVSRGSNKGKARQRHEASGRTRAKKEQDAPPQPAADPLPDDHQSRMQRASGIGDVVHHEIRRVAESGLSYDEQIRQIMAIMPGHAAQMEKDLAGWGRKHLDEVATAAGLNPKAYRKRKVDEYRKRLVDSLVRNRFGSFARAMM